MDRLAATGIYEFKVLFSPNNSKCENRLKQLIRQCGPRPSDQAELIMAERHQSGGCALPNALPNIKELDREALADALSRLGQPKFRAAQVSRWLFSQQAQDFDAMTTLPSALRETLAATYAIRSAEVVGTARDEGGPERCGPDALPTVKYLMRMTDGELIESVLIPSGERMTACLSSQSGCALQCAFCATGSMGFRRNLGFSEMTDQAFALHRQALKTGGKGLTNIVFMGMGEPLLNLDNVFEAVRILTEQDYDFSLGERRITISTAGLPAGMERIARSGLKTKLAVSLHAADQGKRERMMPVARQHDLEELGRAIAGYNSRTGLPVTLVYMLLEGVNDSPEDARKLARYARRFLCRINLIDYNSIVNLNFKPAYDDTRNAFVRLLLDAGQHVTVRKSQGASINAACGQLAAPSGSYGQDAQ